MSMASEFTRLLAESSGGFDFVAAHFDCERNSFSENNPNGYVNFGSAQNMLAVESMQQRLGATTALLPAVSAPENMKYHGFHGMESCRERVAEYLGDIALPGGRVSLSSENVILANGLVGLLEALAFALLDEGESVLVPTPVFPGLLTALSLRLKSHVSMFHTGVDSGFQLSPELLEKSLVDRRQQGERIGAVLLCSPGNPVGKVFSEDEVREFSEIAARHDCALFVDEVYAGSCFQEGQFFSAAALREPHVYVLGGLSKDFGVAGYATGWAYITNDDVRRSVAKQSHFFRLPTTSQMMTEAILEPQWRANFLSANRERLLDRYLQTTTVLREIGIPFESAGAGLCLWMDLRRFLATEDAAGEFELYEYLLKECRVHISPGSGFRAAEFGYFRMCFSHTEPTLLEGLRRLTAGLEAFSNSFSVPVA